MLLSLPCSRVMPAMREPIKVFARTTLALRWSRRKPIAALSARFSRKVTFQVWPAAKATPLPEASFRRTRLPTEACVSGA